MRVQAYVGGVALAAAVLRRLTRRRSAILRPSSPAYVKPHGRGRGALVSTSCGASHTLPDCRLDWSCRRERRPG